MQLFFFKHFSNGQESYFYQLFIEKDDRIVLPTTQQLLGQSFLQSDIKLAEVNLMLYLLDQTEKIVSFPQKLASNVVLQY